MFVVYSEGPNDQQMINGNVMASRCHEQMCDAVRQIASCEGFCTQNFHIMIVMKNWEQAIIGRNIMWTSDS